jgi:hypothetical protein
MCAQRVLETLISNQKIQHIAVSVELLGNSFLGQIVTYNEK